MSTQAVRQTLHQLIDEIEDEELLTLHLQLLEREFRKSTSKNFFSTSEKDLVSRAKASLASVEAGRTRSIKEFQKDIEEWKKKRATM